VVEVPRVMASNELPIGILEYKVEVADPVIMNMWLDGRGK